MAKVLTPRRVASDAKDTTYEKRLVQTEKDIKKIYQERIDKANDFVKNNDMSLKENKRQVNIIISGNEE